MNGYFIFFQRVKYEYENGLGNPADESEMRMGKLQGFLIQVRKFKPDFITHNNADGRHHQEIQE